MAFAPLNDTARKEAVEATGMWAAALRELSPDTGAYMNEVSFLFFLSFSVWSREGKDGLTGWQRVLGGMNRIGSRRFGGVITRGC